MKVGKKLPGKVTKNFTQKVKTNGGCVFVNHLSSCSSWPSWWIQLRRVGSAFWREPGPRLLESVYEAILVRELSDSG